MSTKNVSPIELEAMNFDVKDHKRLSRRNFLGYLGGAAAIAALASSCAKEFPVAGEPGEGKVPPGTTVNLGSGDVGILNYAYSLEQLEAAFYTLVLLTPYHGMSSLENSRLSDIRDHEIVHREFLKDALGTMAIPSLTLDFSSINFSSRASVLGAAKTFEDLGVSAYNGAGQLISNPDYLTIAGKIVSVEARHAAYIRDIISYGTFADNTVISSNGLDMSNTPATVLAAASTFVKTKLNASNLPTS